MAVAGRGRKGILVIGESPGVTEDARGKPFIGPAGRFLQDGLGRCGVDLFEDCWVSNALICHPPGDKIPRPQMVDYCRPNVMNAITRLRPTVVIPLGATAVESVIRPLWGEDPEGVYRWAGWQIPCRRWNCWLCPTWHPSYIIRENEGNEVIAGRFQEHLAAAAGRVGKGPYTAVPDERREVQVVLDPEHAARVIKVYYHHFPVVAFDYETTTLKPEGPHARIVSCALCGRQPGGPYQTVAFPWHGAARKATAQLLFDRNVAKAAGNLIFEEHWTRAVLGRGVRHWHRFGDTVINAHGLDSRPGVSGVKFQALVRLGLERYDRHLERYLEAREPGGNSPNRIREVDLPTLLMYNGIDALVEYKVWEIQTKELGDGLCAD
jgi:DNA polymerase